MTYKVKVPSSPLYRNPYSLQVGEKLEIKRGIGISTWERATSAGVQKTKRCGPTEKGPICEGWVNMKGEKVEGAGKVTVKKDGRLVIPKVRVKYSTRYLFIYFIT